MTIEAQIEELTSKGFNVKDMENGKLLIDDPSDRIPDFFIYDVRDRAIDVATNIVASWEI